MEGLCVARQPNVFETIIWKIRRLFEKERPSNLHLHALREFKALGYKPVSECGDGPDKWMQENVLELLDVFGKQGHSGFSAAHCVALFKKLARYQPLCPLTGDSDEWNDISEACGGNVMYQNNRCSHVFKDNGGAYDIDGVIFEEPNGVRFTGHDSRVPITFPYTPKSVIAHVPFEASTEERAFAAQIALESA